MNLQEIKFTLRVFANLAELSKEDVSLLTTAKNALNDSYSPYSGFKVAAAVL